MQSSGCFPLLSLVGLRAAFQSHFRSGRKEWETVAAACGAHSDEDVLVFVPLSLFVYVCLTHITCKHIGVVFTW